MENTAKIGLLLLALALPACHTPSPYASFGRMPLTPIRPDSALFTSTDGRLFLRLPFREVHEDTSHDPPYDFFEYMYRFDDREYHLLAEVLDVPTFRRVPGTSNYWMDKRAVYTDPCLSLPGQQYFFELGPVGQVRFSADPDTAFVGSYGWYRGVPLEWGLGKIR